MNEPNDRDGEDPNNPFAAPEAIPNSPGDDPVKRSPTDGRRPWRFSLARLLLIVLGVALLLGASRLYLFAAISPRGLLIAAVMGVVGITVGRVVGQVGSKGPKVVLFIVCLLFYAGLAGGQIAPGEPFTMWAFLCATAALMIGILSVDHWAATHLD